MRTLTILLLLGLLAAAPAAQEVDSTLDNNTAFFEGKNVSYVITPPDGFLMVMDEAIADGYSFAFIPKDEAYDSATVRIGIHIFRIKDELKSNFSIDQVISEDTAGLREHFGETIVIGEVDSVVTKSGFAVRNFFLNDTTVFIPNVMMSYLHGGSEILIFDLSIMIDYPRFMAEQVYMECLEQIKVLVKGTLEVG